MSSSFVVFGLGNPGSQYARTRHNLGFRVVDRLAAEHGSPRWSETRAYRAARVSVRARSVELVKPTTFMNLSGVAVRLWTTRRATALEDTLVVVDDIALPLGQLRLRKQGSDGGHNGLKSIIREIGSMDFPRLRLGIGPCPAGMDAAEFVLGRFAPEEIPLVEAMVERAACCVEAVAAEDFDRVMSAFNAAASEPGNGVDSGRDV